MTFLTIEAHCLEDDIIKEFKDKYGVTIVDRSDEPWSVVFRGEKANLIKMLNDNWSSDELEFDDPANQVNLFSDNYSLFAVEFPDFVLDVKIPEGFTDNSWHNDAMPSWVKMLPNGNHLRLWIDYADVNEREMQGGKRFCLQVGTPDLEAFSDVLTTDDFNEVVGFVLEQGGPSFTSSRKLGAPK